MDSAQKFFEREVDRTPYGAFNWLVGLGALVFVFGGLGLWHAATYVKQKHWFASSNVSGATDALLNNAQAEAKAAASTSQDAASQAAQNQENAAASAATQALLGDSKAAISNVTNSAAASAEQSAASASPLSGAAALQQYLDQ